MANNKNGIDYKAKYLDIRSRFIKSLDVAFRDGYEQGYQSANQDAMQQAQQAQAQQQGQPGNEGVPARQEQGADAYGTELDQAIAALEQELGKAEPSMEGLKKAIEGMKANRLHQSLSKSIKMSNSYTRNLPENSKKLVAMQQSIVDNIMSKWESEAGDTSRNITNTASTEALTKKE